MKQQITYAVLAGNHRQYELWKQDNPDKAGGSFFVSSTYMVRGLRNFNVVKVGDWYRKYSSQDVKEIEMRANL